MGGASGIARHPAPWLFAGWLVILLGCYALGSGLTSTNDGSHYALLRSLHDEGTPLLGANVVFARHDAARFEGRDYSDRAPGVALIGTAFTTLLRPLLGWMEPLRLDPWARPYLVGSESFVALVMLLPALAAALLFPVLYGLLRELELSLPASLALAFTALPGTLLLRYGTVLYSHVFATLLVTVAVLAWLRWGRRGGLARLALGSAALSWAVVVEYPTVLLFVPAIAWGLAHPSGRGRRPAAVAVVVAAALPALAALLAYNQASFGDPFTIAHFHHRTVSEHHELASTFDWRNIPRHGWLLLFEPRRFHSLFGASPQLLAALPGLAIAFTADRERWRDWTWMLASLLLAWLPAAAYAVAVGGYDRDHRQMLYGLPFLLVFVGLAMRRLEGRSALAGWSAWATATGYAAMAQLEHLRHAGQTSFGSHWVNAGPALWNTLPLVLAAFVLTLAWIAAHPLRPRGAEEGRA